MGRNNGKDPKQPKIIKANFPPATPPPLADFSLRFKTGTKIVILHIPHTELDKVAYLLYMGLKKEGITCSIEEKK